MFKKSKGFTLIELLIVVAIIGILAALLIPNAMSALQKAKQKGTMKDIMTITTACMDYVTDNGVAPTSTTAQNGVYAVADSFYTAICPFYVKSLPVNDQWGNDFYVFSSTNVASKWGIPPTPAPGTDDFVVGSKGRDGADGPGPYYTAADPTSGFYIVSSMADFNKDLATWNGAWIVGPITRAGGV